MVRIEVRDDFSLLTDAFSIHQQIPEFELQSSTYDQWIERLNHVQHPLILIAYIDNHAVGYMIGYERYSSHYIWLAGVLPNYRRQGIFRHLLTRVEQWAIQGNYNSLTIKTRNRFKSMLLLLIANDFKLIDIDKRESVDTHRLILAKTLFSSQDQI